MSRNDFINNIYGNLIDTVCAFVILLLFYGLFYFFVIRRIKDLRQRQQWRIRSFYVASVIFVFLMTHVWVNGFTHLLTILGLVSAGLVVTNKETIMNFVGWLVITWRGLFSEDDLIQIQQYKGYVKRIGILYFTLYEVSDTSGNMTGRVIRIPNGLISTNALLNFSQNSHLLEQCFTVLVSKDNDFVALKNQAKAIAEHELSLFYRDRQEFSAECVEKRDKELSRRVRLGVQVSLQPKAENLSTLLLVVRYFCFSHDAEKLQEYILLAFLKAAEEGSSICLA